LYAKLHDHAVHRAQVRVFLIVWTKYRHLRAPGEIAPNSLAKPFNVNILRFFSKKIEKMSKITPSNVKT
jgi:hypothetical protein